MSSDGTATGNPEWGGYFVIAATVLCCYEYLLTLNAEAKYVWRRRLSGGSILFVINRYAMLAASLANIVQALPPHLQVSKEPFLKTTVLDGVYSPICQVTLRLSDICIVLVYASYAVFAALRMYALYGMNKAILVAVLLSGAVNPCIQLSLTAIQAVTTTSPTRMLEADTAIGSRMVDSSTLAYLQWGRLYCIHQERDDIASSGEWIGHLLVALRIQLLVFELVLVGLTWKKTLSWTWWRTSKSCAPFTTVLLRDGTLYFITIAVINSLNLCGVEMNATALPEDVIEGLYLVCPLVDVITSICMSRFLLNLLAAAKGDYEYPAHHSSRWDTLIRFAQVEMLGAQLCDTLNDGLNGGASGERGRENGSFPGADKVEFGDMDVLTRENV